MNEFKVGDLIILDARAYWDDDHYNQLAIILELDDYGGFWCSSPLYPKVFSDKKGASLIKRTKLSELLFL